MRAELEQVTAERDRLRAEIASLRAAAGISAPAAVQHDHRSEMYDDQTGTFPCGCGPDEVAQ